MCVQQFIGNFWVEDLGCYFIDEEIGVVVGSDVDWFVFMLFCMVCIL